MTCSTQPRTFIHNQGHFLHKMEIKELNVEMGNAGIRAMMEHLHSNYTFNTSWRCHKTLLREAARDPSPSAECPVVKWNLARDRAPPNLLVSGVTVSRCPSVSTGLREILHCLERAPTGAFLSLKVPTSGSTVQNLLIHYAKQVFKHGW